MKSIFLLAFLQQCLSEQLYYGSKNRSTPSGIAAYRSALTLDWLKAEDSRQREMVSTFERDPGISPKVSGECISYARPAPGKIARLMLELLRNLEGDDGTLIPDLVHGLVRNKLLMETSILDAEPDLESLVETPRIMAGEPHTTFPRLLTVVWLLVTDPATTKIEGWCLIDKVNKFMKIAKPPIIAKQMRDLDPIIARVRFIMEEFIQSVTPINLQTNIMNKRNDVGKNNATTNYPRKNRMMSKAHSRRFLYPDKLKAVDLNSLSTTRKSLSARHREGLTDNQEGRGANTAYSKDIGQIVQSILILTLFLY